MLTADVHVAHVAKDLTFTCFLGLYAGGYRVLLLLCVGNEISVSSHNNPLLLPALCFPRTYTLELLCKILWESVNLWVLIRSTRLYLAGICSVTIGVSLGSEVRR